MRENESDEWESPYSYFLKVFFKKKIRITIQKRFVVSWIFVFFNFIF